MFLANKLNKGAGAPEPKDAQFNYVTMLLHGDGTNGAQNNTFLDSSTNNFTITRNGNTTQGSFSPYGSNWSNNFGSANFFYSASNAAFAFGTGDFTVEAWVNPSSYGTLSYVLGVAVTDGLVFYVNSGNLVVRAYNTGDLLSSSTIPAIGAWTHVAATRSGTTLRIFVNGVQTATTTNSTNFAQGAIYAGNDSTNAAPWFGYISNLRVVKGTAVYTSNFTPSTTPLTAISGTSWLVSQSNRFVDNSTNNFAIITSGSPSVQRFNPFGASTAYSTSVIGGSGYFDGTGDYLSVADSASLELGSSDFCLEGWYFPQSFSANLALVSKRATTTSVGAAIIYANSGSGALTFYASTNGSSYFWSGTTVGTMVLNQWNHFAVYRSGNNWYGAINGVVSSMGSNASSIYNNTDAWTIGGDTNGNYANGYIASSRIVIGSAVYGASNFTPPTAPLTAITNTSLLLAYTNGAIFDNAMMNDLETVGNAQISTSVKKYGTGSLAFDGTGDYLIGQVSPNLSFGTGDFTIEGWGYVTSTGATFQCMLAIGAPVQIYARSGTIKIYFNDTDDTSTYIVNGAEGPASSVSPNTWFHFAVVRNGTTFSAYVNGVAGTPTTGISDQVALSANPISLGIYGGTLTLPFTGYMDDIRITKGYARYTANFTAPTAAFPNIGPV